MIETARLRLRQWRDEDLDAWAALNRDPEVMAHFPGLLTREQADASAERIRAFIDERGYGLWAVEVIGGAPFIGFCGIRDVPFEAHFTPAVEIGWRLARASWGFGYASEAARASLEYGFDELGLDEIVAMVVPANQRSIAVCERIGMRRDPDGDFVHPTVQQLHALYRLP